LSPTNAAAGAGIHPARPGPAVGPRWPGRDRNGWPDR